MWQYDTDVMLINSIDACCTILLGLTFGMLSCLKCVHVRIVSMCGLLSYLACGATMRSGPGPQAYRLSSSHILCTLSGLITPSIQVETLQAMAASTLMSKSSAHSSYCGTNTP